MTNYRPMSDALSPRTYPVREVEISTGVFGQKVGPCRTYERRVRPDGGSDVALRLDVPIWGWMFRRPMARFIRSGRTDPPWYLAPETLPQSAARTLGVVCALTVTVGYCQSLLAQTNTYTRQEFGLTNGQMGVILTVTRLAALIGLAGAAAADRFGRRTLIIWSISGMCVGTLATGLAPNAAIFAACQVVARGAATSAAILIAIAAIEVVPARSRAFATAVAAFAAGPGAGGVLLVLGVADKGPAMWRWLYVAPVLACAIPIVWLFRRLEETERFNAVAQARSFTIDPDSIQRDALAAGDPAAAPADRAARAGRSSLAIDAAGRRTLRRRLIAFGAISFCLALFVAPYANGFNDHLRVDRHFSGVTIALFQTVTNAPYAIGVLIGGKLAERYGRRIVGGVALAGSAAINAAQFFFTGPAFWMVSGVGSFGAGPLLPTLSVASTESFPTTRRGTATGVTNVVAVIGSAIGLVLGGILTDRIGFPGTIAVLAIAPITASVLVWKAIPEGAGHSLEELNPGEPPPSDNVDALPTPEAT